MANLLDVVREEFFSRLQSQTNWGKNQIQALYNEVQLEVLNRSIGNEQILNPNLLVNDSSPRPIPINNKEAILKLADSGSIRHRYWLDSGIWCPSLLDVPDKYKNKENTAFDNKVKNTRGLYNPRGTSAYDSMETQLPNNDDNPFFADEDINKDSR